MVLLIHYGIVVRSVIGILFVGAICVLQGCGAGGPSMGMGDAPSGSLKVLVLHGVTMTGAGMQVQMAPLVDHTPNVSFFYPDAPYEVDSNSFWVKAGFQASGKAWFTDLDSMGQGATDFADQLASYIDQQCGGSVDVLLGYSQGGFAISALLRSQWKDDQRYKNVRAIVMLNTGGADLFQSPAANLKSLHAFSREDQIVDPEKYSRPLANKFTEPVIVEHGGTHFPPLVPEVVDALPIFLAGL